MERLGDTFEWGEILLGVLEKNGWTIRRWLAFAGDGVTLSATHPHGHDVEVSGPTVAAAATPLFCACVTRIPAVDEEQQLALDV